MNNFRSSVQRGAGLAAIMAMLGGCAVGPDFVRPAPPETDRYTSEPRPEATVAADGQAQHFTPGAAITADWWRLFQSAQLDAVVRQALSNNPTLRAAEASLRQSQDNLRAGYGLYFPQGQAELSASRQRTAPVQQGSRTSGTVFNLFTASGTISYALDVFGGKRRTVEGLRAQADSQRYESKAAYLALSANVVNTSIARAAYTAQIRATEQLIELENQQLHLAETQVRAGTAPYSTVLSVRSLLAANQALLAPLEQNASQAGHLLATLEGVEPSKATLPDIDLTGLSLPMDLPVSLPSDLVRQRPDILSAEALMHVASANIGIATAAMYPSFSLSGTYGGASTSFANLSAVSKFWSIGPTATTPVFQGNSLWYVRRAAIDAYQQSQANYRQTVLGAFEQVADSLKALEHDAGALQAQVEAQRAAGEALNLLQVNYRAGLAAYPDVLTADVQFHQATIAWLQAVAQRHQDTVALFVALGGGWWNEPRPAGKGEAP
ncbi:MAG: efflux transporter outer membrane subunit [Verrucomicrobiota bacterium]|jgi:NodT family efflux transporter outer membrane factor (OMF) lipoprotein